MIEARALVVFGRVRTAQREEKRVTLQSILQQAQTGAPDSEIHLDSFWNRQKGSQSHSRRSSVIELCLELELYSKSADIDSRK